MQTLGFNYRLTDFQAALGMSQLKRANEGLETRRQIAQEYHGAFEWKEFILGQSGFVNGHAYHLYVIEVSNRLGLYNYLRNHNIYAQIHYIPCHLMPYYSRQGWKPGDLPVSETYYNRCISLPMYPSLESDQMNHVIRTVSDYYE
jgi:dTDP-4-amino-4,6-dideoxygalactose transaminase